MYDGVVNFKRFSKFYLRNIGGRVIHCMQEKQNSKLNSNQQVGKVVELSLLLHNPRRPTLPIYFFEIPPFHSLATAVRFADILRISLSVKVRQPIIH